jgi:hypothetical protein
MKNEQLPACPAKHHAKPPALIWTFAFRGAEFWCAQCGRTFGAIGVPKADPWRGMKAQLQRDTARTKPYLQARGIIAGFTYPDPTPAGQPVERPWRSVLGFEAGESVTSTQAERRYAELAARQPQRAADEPDVLGRARAQARHELCFETDQSHWGN